MSVVVKTKLHYLESHLFSIDILNEGKLKFSVSIII